MSAKDYPNLLYQLERLRTGDADAHARATQQVAEERRKLSEASSQADTERAEITTLAGQLQAQVPDLRAMGDATKADATITSELDDARQWLTKAARYRESALRTAQLPALLPRAHHFIRNLVVYGAAMLACVATQMLLFALIAAGVLPDSVNMWVVFIVPVVFLIVGYIATGIAGSPRVPIVDQFGKEIEFTVYKSPRLGVALAVTTMVSVLLWDLS